MKLDAAPWRRWLEARSKDVPPAAPPAPGTEGPGNGGKDTEPGLSDGGEGPWSIKSRSLRLLLVLGVVGLLFMTWGAPRPPAGDPASPASVPAPAEPVVGEVEWGGGVESSLSRALEEALGRMRGVGRVHVLVTLETSGQHMFAGEVTREKRVSEEGQRVGREERESRRPVLVRSPDGRSETALIEGVRSPRVRGVLVVAEGGDDPRVRRAITQAVEAVTGLGAHRVVVLGGR